MNATAEFRLTSGFTAQYEQLYGCGKRGFTRTFSAVVSASSTSLDLGFSGLVTAIFPNANRPLHVDTQRPRTPAVAQVDVVC